MIVKCVKCGQSIKFEPESKEERFICPICGQRNWVKSENNRAYSIDDALYMIGENIPFQRKKDYQVSFQNKCIKEFNRFLALSRIKRIGIIAGLALLFICPIIFSIITAPCAIEKTQAYANMETLWKEFRQNNPYNFQTVAIKSFEDKSHIIILSEPSENLTEESLKKFLNDYNCTYTSYKQKIGLDGWMRDAVISINGLSKSGLKKFGNKLFTLLYSTDYKAVLWDITTMPKHIAFSERNLNYQVSSEELNKWFLKDKELLVCLEDSNQVNTLPEILNKGTENTLYYSKYPGFVIWILSRTISLDEIKFRINSRKFALDSDLILGAIANNNYVAIIAREREIPLHELPPMRQETILMLASTDKTELSQSYERNNVFAGKLDGGKDFAPILLSDELWHTEYGNLLNVTDQMLKSWSENGNIEYTAFDYPKPFDWAFNKGVINDLSVSSLTYNWNTAGAGYIVEDGNGFNIYAVNRTGSLPVSYIPGETDDISESDPVFLAEEKAYDFYSGLQNPELVKVVQYASIYQIFINYGINVDYKISSKSLPTTKLLDNKLEAILHKICDYHERPSKKNVQAHKTIIDDGYKPLKETESYSDEQIKRIREYFEKERFVQLEDRLLKNYEKEYDEISSTNEIDSVKRKFYAKLITSIHLNSLKKRDTPQLFMNQIDTINSFIYDNKDAHINDDESFLTVVSHYINNPRRIDKKAIFVAIQNESNLDDRLYCQYTASILLEHAEQIKTYADILKLCDLNEAYKLYIKENKDKSLNWQKCPTVVLSWSPRDSIFAVGGHNLDSKVTSIKVNESLKPGEYKIATGTNGRKVVEVASSDKGRVTPSFLRRVERTNLIGHQKFSKAATRIRPRSEVMPITVKRAARGFNQTDHLMIAKENGTFIVGDKKVSSVDELFSEISKCVDNGEEVPCKVIEFKSTTETDMHAIIDGMKDIRMKKGFVLKDIPCKSFDISKIEIENLPNGNSRVRIPISAEEIYKAKTHIQYSSLEGGVLGKPTFWTRVKTFFLEFEVSSLKVNEFVSTLKSFLKNPQNTWDNFLFKRHLRSIGIEPAEYDETYNILIALHNNKKHVQVDFFKKEIA